MPNDKPRKERRVGLADGRTPCHYDKVSHRINRSSQHENANRLVVLVPMKPAQYQEAQDGLLECRVL